MPPILQDTGAIVQRGVHDVTDPLDIDHGIWLPITRTHAFEIVHRIAHRPPTITRLLLFGEEGRSRSVAWLYAVRPRWPHAHSTCLIDQTITKGTHLCRHS